MRLPAAHGVVAYAAWQCRDLPQVWAHEPVGCLGPLAFGLWSLPALRALASEPTPGRACRPMLVGVLGLLLLGSLLDSALPRHLALATALASFLGPSRRRFGYLVAALAWLPTTGWLLVHQLGLPAATLQLLGGLAGASMGCPGGREESS